MTGQTGKFLEGVDESVADFPGVMLLETISSATMPLDTSMMELPREEGQVSVGANSQNVKSATQSVSAPANNNNVPLSFWDVGVGKHTLGVCGAHPKFQGN